ncbi:MAG: hypothetical protein Q9M94_07725 [Candidatus Gracilibacteria bacterium]|nr:hypothetical protein [Candidatus Gracilibacteria bacterium]MDQ7021931.1 hypothetical protein [Candidatus Gracilibacteria bacterium]
MLETNEIIGKNNTPIFEISKEDILNYSLNKNLKNSIYKFLEKNKTLKGSDIFNLLISLKSNINRTLSSLNIKNSQVKTFQVFPNGILKITTNINGKKDIHSFDLNQNLDELKQEPLKDIYLGNEEQVKNDVSDLASEVTEENLEKTGNILNAMDYVFEKNGEEWFGELDESDRLDTDKYGNEIVGDNLTQLQTKFKENFDRMNSIPKEYLSKEMVVELARQEILYFRMVMGFGHKYEGAATLLKEDTDNFEKMADNILKYSGTNEDLLYKLKDLHLEIDLNDYQSTTVERSYKFTMDTLHKKIFNKLVKEKANDKDLVLFAKIITGKEIDGVESEIDDNLRDPELAQKILITILQRKDGIIDKLNKNGDINIDDPEIENENPKSVVDSVRDKFYERYGSNLQSQKIFNNNLKTAGYEDVLNIPENQKYEDLTFYQKTKLSVLHRVAEKMEEGKDFLERSGERALYGLQLEGSKMININHNYILSDFAGLFNSVAQDYIEEVAENLKDNFSENESTWESITFGKDSSDVGLTGVQAEAFDLFQDISGAGLLGISDSNIENLKTGGKMLGTMAIAMAVPFLIIPAITGTSMGIIAAGVTSGASASLASMAINPKGYDTREEAVVDVISDIGVGAATGALGSKYLNPVNASINRQALAMSTDLVILGFGTEVWRMKKIDEHYHNQELLTKTGN